MLEEQRGAQKSIFEEVLRAVLRERFEWCPEFLNSVFRPAPKGCLDQLEMIRDAPIDRTVIESDDFSHDRPGSVTGQSHVLPIPSRSFIASGAGRDVTATRTLTV